MCVYACVFVFVNVCVFVCACVGVYVRSCYQGRKEQDHFRNGFVSMHTLLVANVLDLLTSKWGDKVHSKHRRTVGKLKGGLILLN